MSGKRSSSRRMVQLTKDFYEAGKAASKSSDPEVRASSYCWLDNTPINYDVEPNSSPDSHNLDHYYSVAEHPELQFDPTNFRHSHALCNWKRSNHRIDGCGLGDPVPQWW